MTLLTHYIRKILYKVISFKKRGLEFEAFLDEALERVYIPKYHHTIKDTTLNKKPLRILYVCLKYDYGNPKQGLSFEENAFFHTLVNMGYEIIRFDFKTLERRFGKRNMNRMLREAVYRYNPDLLFSVLFKNELDKSVIREISTETQTTTINWFCDDLWRFDSYSRYWTPMFNWIVTTHKSILLKYQKIDYKNAILSQWACNHFLYRKLDLPYQYDVTFIGQPFGYRKEFISRLRKAGINVSTWGYGWPAGRVTAFEMVKIFNQSKINLDFAEFSRGGKGVKARPFEVAGCGGFVLTEYVDKLSEYYDIGKEVECFSGFDELISKIKYYLNHNKEREAIAQKGYEKTLAEHTYQKRFKYIFNLLGLE